MLHRHAALYLSLAAIIAQAQDPTSIHAPIQRVRLHPDEAWITRVGSIQLSSAGHHAVQIQGLPQGLNLEDVRISAHGPAGTRLGEVSVRHEPQPYRDLPEWKRLRTEWAALEEEAFQGDLLAKGQAQAIQLFEQLSEHQLREAQGRLGMGEIQPQAITDLVHSIQTRSLELQRAKFASALHMEELNQRRARVQEAQDTIKREAEARPVRVLAEVEVLRPGQVEVELTYRTRSHSCR